MNQEDELKLAQIVMAIKISSERTIENYGLRGIKASLIHGGKNND